MSGGRNGEGVDGWLSAVAHLQGAQAGEGL